MTTIISDMKHNGDPNSVSYGKKAGNGFQYILKHGLGPGVLPTDVKLIRSVCLSNNYTVVYTDRVLSTDELKNFDIPNESDNKYYLDGVEL